MIKYSVIRKNQIKYKQKKDTFSKHLTDQKDDKNNKNNKDWLNKTSKQVLKVSKKDEQVSKLPLTQRKPANNINTHKQSKTKQQLKLNYPKDIKLDYAKNIKLDYAKNIQKQRNKFNLSNNQMKKTIDNKISSINKIYTLSLKQIIQQTDKDKSKQPLKQISKIQDNYINDQIQDISGIDHIQILKVNRQYQNQQDSSSNLMGILNTIRVNQLFDNQNSNNQFIQQLATKQIQKLTTKQIQKQQIKPKMQKYIPKLQIQQVTQLKINLNQTQKHIIQNQHQISNFLNEKNRRKSLQSMRQFGQKLLQHNKSTQKVQKISKLHRIQQKIYQNSKKLNDQLILINDLQFSFSNQKTKSDIKRQRRLNQPLAIQKAQNIQVFDQKQQHQNKILSNKITKSQIHKITTTQSNKIVSSQSHKINISQSKDKDPSLNHKLNTIQSKNINKSLNNKLNTSSNNKLNNTFTQQTIKKNNFNILQINDQKRHYKYKENIQNQFQAKHYNRNKQLFQKYQSKLQSLKKARDQFQRQQRQFSNHIHYRNSLNQTLKQNNMASQLILNRFKQHPKVKYQKQFQTKQFLIEDKKSIELNKTSYQLNKTSYQLNKTRYELEQRNNLYIKSQRGNNIDTKFNEYMSLYTKARKSINYSINASN